MIEDHLSVRADVSYASITSSINRCRYPQSLVRALIEADVFALLPFDYCTLVLPDSNGQGTRIWRAARIFVSDRLAALDDSIDRGDTLLSRLLDDGSAKLLQESALASDGISEFGEDVKSALALPLSIGSKCFGLVCFASVAANTYTRDDTGRLMWLADHVAAAAHGMLLRIRLESMSEGLLEMDRLKNGFVNTLVRDIRLPLTSVLGILELFESKLEAREQFDYEDRHLLKNAIDNGDRMRHLLDNHLEIARQHQEPLALSLQDAKADELLDEIAEPLRGEAALRGVELNICAGSGDLSLRVDDRQIRRALNHLMAVALAATPDGGAIQLEAQTIMGTRLGDEGRRFVIISISDSSQGIPPEEVPFVFDAFWQTSEKRDVGGQGLGLAIAKRIAAAHSGNVSVRSQRGRGTVYSLVLPAVGSVSSNDNRRVLIVDDAPELLLLLRKLIARMGYQVEVATGARDALEILKAKRIDLVLTDWAMPEINGGELIAILKRDERTRKVPTIVLTGHDTDNERLEAEAVGCDRFLVKPVMRDELRRVIVELLPAPTEVKR